jgi:hypothetical protein
MNRKRVILAALLGVLALCLVYAYLTMPRLEKAPPRKAGQRVQRSVKVTGTLESKSAQERIDFAFLTSEPQEFSRAKRDIFRFGGRHPVMKGPVTAPILDTPPDIESEPIQPVAVDVVAKALSQFTFLGFLEKAGEKTVFLSSGGNLFLVKRGESFGVDQEFLVADIDDDLLKVSHAGREGLVEIKLIEQKKLSASVSAPAHLKPSEKLPNQQKPGVFTPKRRVAQPGESQKKENPFKKITEKNNPAAEKKSKRLPTGLLLEGDVNGTNQ